MVCLIVRLLVPSAVIMYLLVPQPIHDRVLPINNNTIQENEFLFFMVHDVTTLQRYNGLTGVFHTHGIGQEKERSRDAIFLPHLKDTEQHYMHGGQVTRDTY